jgi:hypothetical protein
MPPPVDHVKNKASRITGFDLRDYMGKFGETFLQGRIQYGVEVVKISRGENGTGWKVLIRRNGAEENEELHFGKLVICTGVSFCPCRSIVSMIYEGYCDEPRVTANPGALLSPLHLHSSKEKFITLQNIVLSWILWKNKENLYLHWERSSSSEEENPRRICLVTSIMLGSRA